MVLPFQTSRIRFSSVTVATIVASRFSSAAYFIKVYKAQAALAAAIKAAADKNGSKTDNNNTGNGPPRCPARRPDRRA